MQKIIHTDSDYSYVHPILSDFERVYAMFSEKGINTHGLLKPSLKRVFEPLQSIFNEYGDYYYDYELIDYTYPRVQLLKYDPKNIIVCFSGGKDSLATALHYKKLGYHVYLYHVSGVNKTYYDEAERAKELAADLNFPIIVEDVSYTGWLRDYVEHPMKNMIIANMALNYGIKNNIGIKIAFGNFRTSTLQEDNFDICAGDCREMWQAYENIIRTIIPRFRIYLPNKNYFTAFRMLIKNPEYLSKVVSCMTPNRFRNQLRKKNIAKYNIDLLPNRCGSCWKCCAEYIFFTDHDVLQYNKDFYKHCLEILVTNSEKETGSKIHSWRSIWSNYFFYDIKKSKYLRSAYETI